MRVSEFLVDANGFEEKRSDSLFIWSRLSELSIGVCSVSHRQFWISLRRELKVGDGLIKGTHLLANLSAIEVTTGVLWTALNILWKVGLVMPPRLH